MFQAYMLYFYVSSYGRPINANILCYNYTFSGTKNHVDRVAEHFINIQITCARHSDSEQVIYKNTCLSGDRTRDTTDGLASPLKARFLSRLATLAHQFHSSRKCGQ